MAVNRGARGWETLVPRINLNPKLGDPVFVQVNPVFAEGGEDSSVVDLVEYKGTWMTREDRLKCKRL